MIHQFFLYAVIGVTYDQDFHSFYYL